MNVFQELKLRNVVRAGVLYIGAVWALAQGIAQLGPPLGAPDWATRWFLFAAAIGFPFWLAFAWFYEFTPQGWQRESEVAADDSMTRSTRKKFDRWIIGVLAIAVVLLLANTMLSHRDANPETSGPVVSKMSNAASDRSIAVLPFKNLSSDPDNAYFAAGMQDEILTRLSKIGALKVISRTSTMNLGSSPTDLPDIAHRLGVAAVLEGSVQKSSDTVHINVQLIRAATDEHIWAESYNRKLADVFGVQGEVAEAVAQALNAALTGAERKVLAVQPTNNTQAYEFYLRGLVLEGRFYSAREDLEQRVADYQKAVDIDPQFALAWAGLARAQTELYANSDHTAERLAAAKHALEQTQNIAPDSAETSAALGAYLYFGTEDYEGAYRAFSTALESRPNDGLVLSMMGNVRCRQGDWQNALALQTRASGLDPLATNVWGNLGMTLRAVRRYGDAQAAFDRGLAAAPEDPALLGQKIETYLAVGDLATADRFAESIPRPLMMNRSLGSSIYALNNLQGRYADNIAILKQVLTQSPPTKWNNEDLAVIHSMLGFAEHRAGDLVASTVHLITARDEFETRRRLLSAETPGSLAVIAGIDATLGNRKDAYRLADKAAQLSADDAMTLPGAIQNQAYVRMLGGESAQAVRLLRAAQMMPMAYGDTAAVLRLDPTWNPLRKEPGFEQLTRGDGLPLQIPAAKAD